MTLIGNIISRLPKLKKSQEFSDIVVEFNASIEAAEGRLEALESSLEDAICESPAKLEKVKAEIRQVKQEIEDLSTGLRAAEKRHVAAIAQEQEQAIEARANEAKNEAQALCDDYIALHKVSLEIIETLKRINQRSQTIFSANAEASRLKRPDLKVEFPTRDLAIKFGRDLRHEIPTLDNVQIPGYSPGKHPDGYVLAALQDLKL